MDSEDDGRSEFPPASDAPEPDDWTSGWGSETAPEREPEPPVSGNPAYPPAPDRPIDPLRELVVIDPTIIGSARARNAVAGAPWSFRTQLEWLAGAEEAGAPFALAWLEQWVHVMAVGSEAAPVSPRPAVRQVLIDPWLSQSGVTSPAATGSDYGGNLASPSLEHFPFRLIAIVNRLDLYEDACAGPPGELRYVYTAVEGAGARPLPMTVIVEIPYPETRSAAQWARAWHELTPLPGGEAYGAGLEALTRAVMRDADVRAVRVRSNERAFGTELPWELREFRLEIAESRRHLTQVALESTPRSDLEPNLVEGHVALNASAIQMGAVVLPPELRAGAAQVPDAEFTWPSANLSEPLRAAFSRETCNGCHGGDTASLPFQHIAPDASGSGAASLSRFLRDPAAPIDELRRRTGELELLQRTVCYGSE